MSKDRAYSVRVDGEEIGKITLCFEDYKDQPARDKIRQMIADHHGISTWGMRLQQIDCPYVLYTDMKTGKTHKLEKDT